MAFYYNRYEQLRTFGGLIPCCRSRWWGFLFNIWKLPGVIALVSHYSFDHLKEQCGHLGYETFFQSNSGY